jgi:hypothetical protein
MPTPTEIEQTPISSYLIGDPYAPPIPKEELAGYDNYQIYDLYCLDRVFDVFRSQWAPQQVYVSYYSYDTFLTKAAYQINNEVWAATELLAVQRYDVSTISFDFEALAKRYSSPNIAPFKTCHYSDTAVEIYQGNSHDGLVYSFGWAGTYYSGIRYIKYESKNIPAPPLPPYFTDFVSGYRLDTRLKSRLIEFISPITGKVKITYYLHNHLEPIPRLRSIDWVNYELDLIKDEKYTINFSGIVLCTLDISSLEVQTKITSIILGSNYYPLSSYFVGADINVYAGWMSLYEDAVDNLPQCPPFPTENSVLINVPSPFQFFYQDKFGVPIVFDYQEFTPKPNILRKIAANNDIWGNDFLTNDGDINFDYRHHLFKEYTRRAYEWHIQPQGINPVTLEDRGIGSLIMDSPLVRMIGYALNAQKYAFDPNTGQPRIANIGHLTEQTAALLGYRPEPDGSFDEVKEKKRTKEVVDKSMTLDATKVGVNNFASDGMVVKRINNRRKNGKIVSDKCVIVKDLPQLIGEYYEQVSLAMGIQESSAVDIQTNGKTGYYNSQLEILTEILYLISATNEMTRSVLISSLVTQGQTNETIAALGLPSVTKTIPVTIDSKTTQIPYKGVAAHRSISQEIATCTNNVGIVLGHVI